MSEIKKCLCGAVPIKDTTYCLACLTDMEYFCEVDEVFQKAMKKEKLTHIPNEKNSEQ